jgi:hypothetical protein
MKAGWLPAAAAARRLAVRPRPPEAPPWCSSASSLRPEVLKAVQQGSAQQPEEVTGRTGGSGALERTDLRGHKSCRAALPGSCAAATSWRPPPRGRVASRKQRAMTLLLLVTLLLRATRVHASLAVPVTVSWDPSAPLPHIVS